MIRIKPHEDDDTTFVCWEPGNPQHAGASHSLPESIRPTNQRSLLEDLRQRRSMAADTASFVSCHSLPMTALSSHIPKLQPNESMPSAYYSGQCGVPTNVMKCDGNDNDTEVSELTMNCRFDMNSPRNTWKEIKNSYFIRSSVDPQLQQDEGGLLAQLLRSQKALSELKRKKRSTSKPVFVFPKGCEMYDGHCYDSYFEEEDEDDDSINYHDHADDKVTFDSTRTSSSSDEEVIEFQYMSDNPEARINGDGKVGTITSNMITQERDQRSYKRQSPSAERSALFDVQSSEVSLYKEDGASVGSLEYMLNWMMTGSNNNGNNDTRERTATTVAMSSAEESGSPEDEPMPVVVSSLFDGTFLNCSFDTSCRGHRDTDEIADDASVEFVLDDDNDDICNSIDLGDNTTIDEGNEYDDDDDDLSLTRYSTQCDDLTENYTVTHPGICACSGPSLNLNDTEAKQTDSTHPNIGHGDLTSTRQRERNATDYTADNTDMTFRNDEHAQQPFHNSTSPKSIYTIDTGNSIAPFSSKYIGTYCASQLPSQMFDLTLDAVDACTGPILDHFDEGEEEPPQEDRKHEKRERRVSKTEHADKARPEIRSTKHSKERRRSRSTTPVDSITVPSKNMAAPKQHAADRRGNSRRRKSVHRLWNRVSTMGRKRSTASPTIVSSPSDENMSGSSSTATSLFSFEVDAATSHDKKDEVSWHDRSNTTSEDRNLDPFVDVGDIKLTHRIRNEHARVGRSCSVQDTHLQVVPTISRQISNDSESCCDESQPGHIAPRRKRLFTWKTPHLLTRRSRRKQALR